MTNQITLPRDAEGREIPLDTKVLYDDDGEELDVRHFEFNPISGKWIIAALKNVPHNWIWTDVYRSPQNVYLEKPATSDSWEKLLKDLETCDTCDYFGYWERASRDDYGCGNCKVYKTSENRVKDGDCLRNMLMDIASRIRFLRGEDE